MESRITKYEPRTEVFDTRKVVKTLEGLMTKVTSDKCTAETVNAACNCADKITDILRLHLDVERLKTRFGK
jgi:phage terminase large subunit-like protein